MRETNTSMKYKVRIQKPWRYLAKQLKSFEGKQKVCKKFKQVQKQNPLM